MRAQKAVKEMRYSRFLIILGLFSAFCLSPAGSFIALVGAIAIVGLPLSLIIAVAPSLFLCLILSFGVHKLLPMRTSMGKKLVSFLFACGLLAVPPYLMNAKLTSSAEKQLAGDVDVIPPDIRFATLGVIQTRKHPEFTKTPMGCDDFCQRALLNTQVEKMIMTRAMNPATQIDWNQDARAYWFEQRENCPEIELEENRNQLEFYNLDPNETGSVLEKKSAADLIRLQVAQGNCLVSAPAKIGQADGVLVYGEMKEGKSMYNAGLDFFADTVRSGQLSLYQKMSTQMELIFRTTAVEYEIHLPLVFPSIVTGYGFEVAPGFPRTKEFLGGAKKYSLGPQVVPFLADRLEFELGLSTGEADQDTHAIIRAALDKPGDLSPNTLAVIDDFFQDIDYTKPMSREKLYVALRAFQDFRVPFPQYAWQATLALKNQGSESASDIAAALFVRFNGFEPEANVHPYNAYRPLAAIASAISHLPEGAILPYFPELKDLAYDPVARIYGYKMLSHLGDFGAKSAPLLLYLIDDAERAQSDPTINHPNKWQHPYLAAIGGLCRLARTEYSKVEREAHLEELYQRLDAGLIEKSGSYLRQTINMFYSLGADPERLWSYLKSDNPSYSRDRFDGQIRRAAKEIECTY
ncbi:MAG: hypothetical protein WBC90_03950 [Albidovulum sp.]